MFTGSKNGRLFKGNRFVFPSVLFVLLIFAFSVALKPAASGETDGGVAFEKTVDSQSAKPGERVNFTLLYVNNLGETAYNVTVYDWMPSELTFAGSRPFYDGASDREIGFYRWSRGTVPQGGNGTIVVSALINEVPLGTEIENTAYLAYELGNGTKVEVASSVTVTVTQAAGVDVFPDQIHSVASSSGAQTEYNITLKNTGNALDTFDVMLRSVAYNPSGSTHDWTIELLNSTGYFANSPVATVYDDNSNNRTSWTDHGAVARSTLGMGESTWFMLRVSEAGGTSGSGDAFLDVQFIATSLFDPSVSDATDETTVVKSVTGITFAPDCSKEADPGDTVTFNHIIVNSGQSDIIDLSYVSSLGWSYAFFYANGTLLVDSDGSGYVDVGLVPKGQYVYVLVMAAVPYSTPAGTIDFAVITAKGVAIGNSDTVNDTTTVRSAPMLAVSKRLVSENPGYKGDVVTYEVHIVNVGNTRLIKIPFDDTFETAYLDFSSAQPVEDSYDELAGNIHWESLGALEPNQSFTVTINFVATAGAEAVKESSNVIDAEDEFGNLISATCMNTDLRLVGVYNLTVTASPVEAIGGTFSIIWTNHGSPRDAAFATPKTIACDEGTVVTISHPESPIDHGDTRYVFVDCLPSASLSMDSDKIVTLNYRTEYVLTFGQAGSSESVYITVDGTQLSDALPQSFWIEKGSIVIFSYPSIITDPVGTTRYVLIGVSGNGTATSVTVNAPTIVAGLYKTQYYLSVTTDPTGLDDPKYSGWYDDGTYAQLHVEALTGGDGITTRFRFDHWSGMGINNAFDASTQILVDAPKTATAEFVKQFRFVVVSEHGTPEPPVDEYWYDSGVSVTASVTSPADESGGTRYRVSGWIGSGDVPVSGSTTTVSFAISQPSSITWTWIRQYKLTVASGHGSPSPSVGDHWYDEGVVITASVVSPTDESSGMRFRCLGWFGTGSVVDRGYDESALFTMTAPSSVEWIWTRQYYLTISTDPMGLDEPTGEGWYDEGANAPISVAPLTGGDGVTTRYRFDMWTGAGVVQAAEASTTITVDSPKSAQAVFVKQFYLTMSTNFGDVTPKSGWYDAGSTISIEAFAPTVIEGKGYVWHGWTGTGHGAYSGASNPAEVVISDVTAETAVWKIDPVITLAISNETIANGDRIIVYGKTSPAQPGLAITVLYDSPSGSTFEHTVYTNVDGEFTDTLFLGQHDLYPLLVENGEWDVAVLRLHDDAHENAQASTTLSVESQSIVQFPPILLLGTTLIAGVIAFVPPAKKKKNGNGWRRVAVVLSIAGLILAAVSLLLSWVVVAGTVASNGVVYRVGIQLYPLSQGAVSISDGIRYVGPQAPSMVQMSSEPVLSLYLIPVACVAALIGLYKPKSVRQKNLKTVILAVAGVLIAASVIHTYLFVQIYANAIEGAGIGYGAGAYVAVISCGLTLVSALFASRENNNSFVEAHGSIMSKVRAAFSRVRRARTYKTAGRDARKSSHAEQRSDNSKECAFFFGFLSERPTGKSIPEECFGCTRALSCLKAKAS